MTGVCVERRNPASATWIFNQLQLVSLTDYSREGHVMFFLCVLCWF